MAIFFTSTLVLLYQNHYKNPSVTLTSQTGLTPTTAPSDPTADWKTYTDSNYGISFSYPQDWKVENGSNYLRVEQIEPVQNLIIAIDFKKTTLSIEDVINNFEKTDSVFKQINPNLKPEDILINGLNAKKFEYTDATGLDHVSIIVSDNSHKILIEHRFPSDKIMNQILSTFKFTESTANWKTYENKTLNFSFSYPSEYGDFDYEISNGQTGKSFIGTSSKIRFGGISTDFSDQRGGMFFDFSGFVNTNGSIVYKAVQMYDKSWSIDKELIPEIFTNQYGVEIVLVKGANETGEYGGPTTGTPGEGKFGALINLKNAQFPGIAFEVNSDFGLDNFKQILSTFKFTP